MACRAARDPDKRGPRRQVVRARKPSGVCSLACSSLVLAKVRFDACGESSVQVGRRQDLVLSSHARGKMMTPFKISLSA